VLALCNRQNRRDEEAATVAAEEATATLSIYSVPRADRLTATHSNPTHAPESKKKTIPLFIRLCVSRTIRVGLISLENGIGGQRNIVYSLSLCLVVPFFSFLFFLSTAKTWDQLRHQIAAKQPLDCDDDDDDDLWAVAVEDCDRSFL